jgi:stringent starvation protein B
MTQVVLNTRAEGVSLPDHLMGQEQVVLNLSYAFRLRIFELNTNDVRASLSFGGQEFECVLPWESVYLIRPASGEGEGAMYLEAMPPALRTQLFSAAGISSEEGEALLNERLQELEDDIFLEEEGLFQQSEPNAEDVLAGEADEVPLVIPAPPRPALRRASEDEEEEELDDQWLDRLPQLGEPLQESTAEEEGEVISFQAFLKRKLAESEER